MAMLSNSLITGGVFKQIVDQRQVYTQKSAMDYLREAVAHSAFHNSGERFDPPKCHPNTRVAVLDKIEKWALRTDPDTMEASILWLSGAAGAGKSAIAQTLAERFDSNGHLIGSFFFGRSDSTRNHARSLVATVAYQLYSLLPPTGKSHLLGIIEHDPLIFTKSLPTQFESLIVNPLNYVVKNGSWDGISAPRLVVIDGLDECLGRQEQRNVLLMLSEAVRRFQSPLMFLLASRAEHDIQATFSSPEFFAIHTRLFLDDTYLPDDDIQLFLRDQFEACRTTHPFKDSIPLGWPSDEIVKEITRKSSGQFIYASVVAKYVISSRHRPHHRLDVVLNLQPSSRDLPFSELDTLYTHVFSTVNQQDIGTILRILSFDIIYQNKAPIKDIEHILRLNPGDIPILLCDLAAIIGYHQPHTDHLHLKILHASLPDHLLDSARSKLYYIDMSSHCAQHVTDCFRSLSDVHFGDPLVETMHSAISFILSNLHFVDLTESLCNTLKSFSIPRVYRFLNAQADWYLFMIRNVFTLKFLPAFFDFLKNSALNNGTQLLRQHQTEYDLFLRESLKAYPHESPWSLVLALISIYRNLPIGAFQECFRLHQFSKGPDDATLLLCHVRAFDLGYLQYLSAFLRDPTRSRQYHAGPKLFAMAAAFCLDYLCDHTIIENKAPPRISPQQRLRRLYTPWKWRHRVPKEDIRGWCTTPWLWLRRPTLTGSVSETPVHHRKANDLIYIHSPRFEIFISYNNDPVVMHRFNSERYYLALIYLIHFLPRAAKLDDLVHMCQRLTFASRSQLFPRKSARARSCMQKYAAQWE